MFRTVLALTIMLLGLGSWASNTETSPNFIIIYTDDQGYGDLGSYGSPDIRTPNVDELAAEGMLFTSFYTAPFCGPSRAALMTASYPPRVSLAFNHGPGAKTGIHSGEITIAELLKSHGYATMLIGKWHLGDHPQFMPLRNGFDEFFGLPYSNDMWPYHDGIPLTENAHPRLLAAHKRAEYAQVSAWNIPGVGEFLKKAFGNADLPLIKNETTLEFNPDQTQLTKRYIKHALRFITDNRDKPFFLYLAHSMPHVPLFASARFKGKSIRGLYGDVVEEIDWGVGEIIARLNELGIDENTVLVFASDNGPWLEYGIDGGSAGPLRGGKGTVYEGGVRVPGIVRWPGKIPAGQRSSEIVSNMDILPTFAYLAGAKLPQDRVLDGRNLWPLLSGATDKSPHQEFYYYSGSYEGNSANLMAIRQGRWKLHFENDNHKVKLPLKGAELYDLYSDVGEKFNRLSDHPDMVTKLEKQAQAFNADLKKNTRPIGTILSEGGNKNP